ncbi:MAG: response regulator [Acidobacteria bacterium]|nr:response regulator [Acidobacteriota bacterium]MCK6684414.1 response regulator [Thermoanaerobaculia bacterium]
MHKILLVDDMRFFLDLETSFLLRADCQVLTASTGLEAIRVAKAEQPDLILLDIEMPEMNGIQACRILKSDPSTNRIPVIILTSMQMEEEAKRAGAEHFLRKPIDEPRFLTEVLKFLPLVVRSDERVELNAPVTFWRDGEATEGRLLNLSRTGFFVGSDDVQPVGARLEITFSLPKDFSGKLITAEAIVVRQADGPRRGFGCRFFQISSGAKLFIVEFLEKSGSQRSAETLV